jgi:hypothetical protein
MNGRAKHVSDRCKNINDSLNMNELQHRNLVRRPFFVIFNDLYSRSRWRDSKTLQYMKPTE